jgi:heat shock protein HslJ
MNKRIILLVAVLLMGVVAVAPAGAADAVTCKETYTVAKGDSLSKIAQSTLGSVGLYTAIVNATNALAASDSSYARIDDPARIEVGQKLCIPADPQAALALAPTAATSAVLARTSPVNPAVQLQANPWMWEQTQYNDGKVVTAAEPTRYMLEFFPAGRMAVKADCNTVAATYEITGNQISFVPGPSTLVACPPDSQADEFIKGLANVTSFFFKDGKLFMELKFDSGVMTFTPAPSTLPGTSWNVLGVNNGKGGVVTSALSEKLTMNFGADGKVSGFSGCNTYNGPFTTSGNTIKIGPLGVTRMACEQEANEMETQFLAALQNAATYRVLGDDLNLRDAAGATQVTAKRAAGSAPAAATTAAAPAPAIAAPATLTTAFVTSGLQKNPWKWEQTKYADGSVVTAADPNRYLLEFQPKGVALVVADCNTIRAGYAVNGNQVTFKPGPGTLVACPPDSQANDFINGLAKASTVSFPDGKLVFNLKDNGGTMTFAAAPATLINTAWKVTMINNGKQAVTGVIANTELTLNFGTDTASGKAGCNNFTGGFKVDGTKITIGPLASTMMMCVEPEGIMEQEAQYLAALQAGAVYKVLGNTLEIRDAKGALQVMATR